MAETSGVLRRGAARKADFRMAVICRRGRTVATNEGTRVCGGGESPPAVEARTVTEAHVDVYLSRFDWWGRLSQGSGWKRPRWARQQRGGTARPPGLGRWVRARTGSEANTDMRRDVSSAAGCERSNQEGV